MVISPTPPSVRDVSTLMGRVVLLDDDWRNIEVAMKTGVSAVHLRAKNVTVAVAEATFIDELESMYVAGRGRSSMGGGGHGGQEKGQGGRAQGGGGGGDS